MRIARITTFTFTFLTLIIGIQADRFGGVLGLIISWFGALIGPISIPMLLGLFPAFRNADSRVAITSILSGLVMFIITKYVVDWPLSLEVGTPVLVSGIVFMTMALLNRRKEVSPEVDALLKAVSTDK